MRLTAVVLGAALVAGCATTQNPARNLYNPVSFIPQTVDTTCLFGAKPRDTHLVKAEGNYNGKIIVAQISNLTEPDCRQYTQSMLDAMHRRQHITFFDSASFAPLAKVIIYFKPSIPGFEQQYEGLRPLSPI